MGRIILNWLLGFVAGFSIGYAAAKPVKAETLEQFQERLRTYEQVKMEQANERIQAEQRKFNANIAAGIEQSLYGGTRADAIKNQLILEQIAKDRRSDETVVIIGR